MNAPSRPSLAQRRLSWLLLLALMPMLTFMGHWPSSVPLPGTGSHLSVPLAGRMTTDDRGANSSHGQHCHGDSASCSDAPVQAGVSIGLLSDPLLAIGSGGLLFPVGLLLWRPRRAAAFSPELRPPQAEVRFA